MTNIVSFPTSPFDEIRQTRPDGSEFWSARDLVLLQSWGSRKSDVK